MLNTPPTPGPQRGRATPFQCRIRVSRSRRPLAGIVSPTAHASRPEIAVTALSWLPLEFGVGTARAALPLSAQGITVHGIERPPHIAARPATKPGAGAVPVTIGAITTTSAPETFRLIYLVANTIMNVTTEDDQLAAFAKAATHFEPCGVLRRRGASAAVGPVPGTSCVCANLARTADHGGRAAWAACAGSLVSTDTPSALRCPPAVNTPNAWEKALMVVATYAQRRTLAENVTSYWPVSMRVTLATPLPWASVPLAVTLAQGRAGGHRIRLGGKAVPARRPG